MRLLTRIFPTNRSEGGLKARGLTLIFHTGFPASADNLMKIINPLEIIYLFDSHIVNTSISAGVIPLILEACRNEAGVNSVSF